MAEDESGDSSSGGPEVPTDPEAEAQQTLRYLEALRMQLDHYTQQSEVTQVALEDNERARVTLERMGDVRTGSETLIPVGAGTFIRAAAGENRMVLVSLGKGLMADLEGEKALEILDRRRQALEDQLERILTSVDALKGQAAMLQSRLEELSAAMEPPNVTPMDI